jgi:hypothetical protein
VRRLAAGVGLIIPMGCVIALSFVTCAHPGINGWSASKFTLFFNKSLRIKMFYLKKKQGLGILLLIVGISVSAILWGAGHLVNINDISGPYSGILLGISNTIATVPGIVSPYIVGVITKHVIEQKNIKLAPKMLAKTFRSIFI